MLAYSILTLSPFCCSHPRLSQDDDVKNFSIMESVNYDMIKIEMSKYWEEVMIVLISNKDYTRCAAYVLDTSDSLANPIDMDTIILTRKKMNLTTAQDLYPSYNLNASNYGLF